MAQRRDTGSSKRATPGGQTAAPHGQRGLSAAARATALTLATRNARFLAQLGPSQPIGATTAAFLRPLQGHATPPARATLEQPGHGHDAAAFAAGVQRRYGALSESSWPREEGAFAGDSDLGLTVARVTLHARPARQSAGAPSDGDALATPSASAVGALIAEPLPKPSTLLAVSSSSASADETVPAPPSPRRSLSAVDPRLIRPVTTLETAARPVPRSAAGVTLPDMVVTRPMDDRRAQEANSGIARRQPAHVMAALGRPLPLSVIRTPPRDNEETDWSVTEGRETASNVAPFTSLPGMFDLAASVQRKPEPGAPSPNTAQRVGALRQAAQSTGQPLNAGTRRAMQMALGAELSDVRVHADTAAAEAASALGAQAFTLGDAVYFAQGAFAPHTANGAALLGHELVHTLQQAAPAPQQQLFQAQDRGAARPVDPVDPIATRDDAGATSNPDAARLPASAIPVSPPPAWSQSIVDAAAPGAVRPMATTTAEATSGDMPPGLRAGIMSGERIALFAQDPAGAVAAQGSMAYRAADPGGAGVSPVPATSGPDEQRGKRRAHPDTGQAVAVGRDIGALSSLMGGVDVVLRTGAMRRVTARTGSLADLDAAGWDAGFWPVAPGMGLLLDGAPVGASRSVYAALDMARALNDAPGKMGAYGARARDADGARAGRLSPVGTPPGQPAYVATGRSLPFVGMWGHAQRTGAGTAGVGDERGAGSTDSQPTMTVARSATSAGDALPGALDLAAAIGRKAAVAMDMPVLQRSERQGAAPGQDSIVVARGRFPDGADAGPAGLRAPALSGALNSVSRVAPVVAPGGAATGLVRDAQAPDAPSGQPATGGTGGIGVVGSSLDGTAATAAGLEAAARMARMDHSAYQADDSATTRRADVFAPSTMIGRADVFATGATEAALTAQRGPEARGGDGRVADDVMAVSTMFPSLAGLAALQSFLPAALEGASSSRAGSYMGQAGGSFYRGSWQPIFAPSGSTPRSLMPSVAAPGDAATGLATGASAPGSAGGYAPAAPASTTTTVGSGTTMPELSAGSAMSLPGMSTAEVSGQASRHPLQQTATFRRGVDLSRSMSASASPFAESLELEDQAARAESAVLRLFSSTPMARPAVSMSTLFPVTMGSRMATLSGPSNGGFAVARRSDGAFVSSMPALSLSYAARTSERPSLTAGASPAEPVTSMAPMAPVETIRRAAGRGAAAPADGSSDTVSRMIETTLHNAAVPNVQPGRLGDQFVVTGGGQVGDTQRPGLTPSTGDVAPLAAPSVSADPFGLTALDLGARAQTAWLGAMGIRGPARASADLFRVGETSTTPGAATLSAGGQGQSRFGGEQARSSGAMSASAAGALAGSTILPGMVSLAAGVQRQARVGASTPALQRRLEALEQASSGISAGRLPEPVVRRGTETVLGGDLSAMRVYADTAVSGEVSPAGAARAFASGDAAPPLVGLSPVAASGAVLWGRESLRTGQQAAGIPGVTVTRQGVQAGAGAGDVLSSTSEAETPRTGSPAQRRLTQATSGRPADASLLISPSMLTLAAAPLIGPEPHMVRTATDIQGDVMTSLRRPAGAFVGTPWGAPVMRPVALDRSTGVNLTPAAQPSESSTSTRGSQQSERATGQSGQSGQPGMAGYSGSGPGIVAWLPNAVNGVGGDGRVGRATADRSEPGSRDGSTPMIRPLATGVDSAREAQASGRELDVVHASGAWWAGSASPLLARFAQVRSESGALNGVGLSVAVARLLDDVGATVTVGETGPAGRPTSSERGSGLSPDTVGRVRHALVDRDDSTAHWSVPPDPAALLMARAQDRSFPTRAADVADGGAANLSRRSGSVGSEGGMSVPAALSGAMATSTMLPGMLSLAASVQRKAEAGVGTPGPQRRLQALEHVASSTGRPLEATVRRGMETVLGGDLSGVRVHADTAAAGAASMLGARAFALGNAVYFSQGAYAPGTAAGAALLAHELVHTRQQAAGALDAPQRSALPGHDAGEGESPELEAHAQRTEASVLRLFSDAPLARQADATGGMGGLADMLSRRAEGGAQEASSGFSAAGSGAMLRRTGIATPNAGAVARTAAGAEAGGSASSGGTLAGGMTVIGFPGAAGSAAQRTVRMDPAGGSAAVSRQSGDGVAGALPQAGNVAGHGLPSVDELVGQVIDRVKRQIALDHERSGGFLSDLMR